MRDLAQGEFKANAQRYMDGTFPWENMKELAEIGVLGMSVPEEYGGLGLPVFDTALVLEEIAKICYVTAMALLGEVGVQTRIIATYAPESDQARHPAQVVLRRMPARGLHDRAARRHRRRQLPDQRRRSRATASMLNGVKTLISRADEAGMFVVFTRIDGKPGREGIGCVLVEPGHARLQVTGTLPHDGRREPRRDPVRGLRIAAGEPGDRARTAFASC